MNASDQQKVNHIRDLENAINQLYSAQSNLYDLNFNALNQAGGNQWSGKQHDDFIEKYNAGQSAFNQAPSYIDDMVQEYYGKISDIAWSIEDVPTKLYYAFLG
jgi:hypothetical protein